MRLIVEKINGVVYVYHQDEKLFKKLNRKNTITREEFDKECDSTKYPDFVYSVRIK